MEPLKTPLSSLKNAFSEHFDIFICSSSFEDRCLSVANSISPEIFKRALILSNIDLIDYVGTNKQKLERLFGRKALSAEVSTLDPLFTADSIRKCLETLCEGSETSKILLDVTSFTHESLLILIRLLKLLSPKAIITGVYANASEYSIGDEVNYKWLSRGIGEVRSVLGFPGNIVPSRKTHLILIVGYEHERAAGIIESIEPNSIALGYGRSGTATTDKDKDANEHYMHLVQEMATSFSEVNCFEIPCNDPYGTSIELLKQMNIAKEKDMNILIAPMNNKLSTVGAAWAALSDPDIQMCYAKALCYNYSNYSRPGSGCYIFQCKGIFDN